MSSDQTPPGPPSQPPPPPGQPAAGNAQPMQPSVPQPQQAQQPQGALELHLQGNVMTAGMISPSVRINGYPVPTKYGVNVLPVYAGRNHIDVNMQWMLTYGQAAIDVDVTPGQTLPVWYAPPFHQFARGNIGPDKQKRRGAAVFFAILAVILLIVVVSIAGSALG